MKKEILFVALIIGLAFCHLADAQPPEITYQGQLQNSSAAASGSFDFEFLLFDSGGSQIGPTLARNGVAVANGIFSVNLDFGTVFPGTNRFLEIRVRTSGGGAFTTLSPRQPVNSSPYSLKSLAANFADNAGNATNATNAVTATNFTGNLTGDVTGTQSATTVARLQGRNVTGTSPLDGQVLKYNGATSQWQPDTDDTGSGGSGGTITGVTPGTGLTGGGATGNVTLAIANGGVSTVQLADNGVTDAKIASVGGSKVTGSVANADNATNATTAATATNALSLGGVAANQFLQTNGNGSGLTNFNANNITTGTLSNARLGQIPTANIADSAVTAPKIATSQVVKTLNTLTDNVTLAAGTNITITPAGNTLTIASTGGGNAILNQTTLQAAANFNISGNGTAGGTLSANIFNATTQYNINGSRILSVPGNSTTILGDSAGSSNSGGFNSFFGKFAGQNNTTGSQNSFFGAEAGRANTTGFANQFIGNNAGNTNTTGNSNTVIGDNADVSTNNLTFATAIGAGATVGSSNTIALGRSNGSDTVQVPGELNVTANAGIGTTAPAAKLHVVGSSSSVNTPVAIVQSSGTQIPLAFRSGAVETARVRADNQGNLVLATTNGTDRDMYFRAGDDSSTDMFIQSSTGNVGIGTTAPINRLSVGVPDNVATGPVVGVYGAGIADIIVRDTTANVSGVISANTDRLVVGTVTDHEVQFRTNNVTRMRINGTVTTTAVEFDSFVKLHSLGGAGVDHLCWRGEVGGLISSCSSSIRYKTDVRGFTTGLDLLSRLRPVSYRWKESGRADLGLIAEEVAQVEPLLVTRNKDGEIEGVKYDQIGVVLVNAVREQQSQIEGQQKQIADQAKTIKRQEAEIGALRTHICSQSPSAAFCKP